MTDLTALLAAHQSQPGEDMPCELIAEYLDERGGEAMCPNCDGGDSDYRVTGGVPFANGVTACPPCSGSGVLRAVDFRLRVALRRVCAAPGEDWPRLAYAEVLEGYAGEVVCSRCYGGGKDSVGYRKSKEVDFDYTCTTCRGTGRVSDGRRERGEFIRVQCRIAELDTHDEPVTEDGYHDPEDGADCCLCDELAELRRREGELGTAERRINLWLSAPFKELEDASADEVCGWSRGFIDSLTLSAADWLAVADSVYWSEGQRVACSTCLNRSLERNELMRKYGGFLCAECGTHHPPGTIPRPFVPTAQPITDVWLTTWPGDDGWPDNGRATWVGNDDAEYPAWPSIRFHMPQEAQ